MKKTFLIILFALAAIACSKKEKKLELFSPEAFAYSLDSGWELNISCQAKGYSLFESNGKFYSKLSFIVDLKKPDGSIVNKIQSGKIEQFAKEEGGDTQLNTQIKLDSTYTTGMYTVILNVKDELKGKKTKIEKQFEISE